jgi:hypothetical protein
MKSRELLLPFLDLMSANILISHRHNGGSATWREEPIPNWVSVGQGRGLGSQSGYKSMSQSPHMPAQASLLKDLRPPPRCRLSPMLPPTSTIRFLILGVCGIEGI